jgi:hypothetical protein
VILAHQGGWDEFLMVAVPLLLLAYLLRVADRRAKRIATERETRADAVEPPPDEGESTPG